MKHPTLLVFIASTLAVFGALAWVTRHALSLERQQRQARVDAQVQERVRLALWRMDSKANALIARESARPYFEYQPFYPAERAYTRMLEEVRTGEVLVPSPLLTLRDRYVKLFFQVDSLGIVTSPQAPTGNLRDLAEAAYVSPADVIGAGDRLEAVSEWLLMPRTVAKQVMSDANVAPPVPSPEADVRAEGVETQSYQLSPGSADGERSPAGSGGQVKVEPASQPPANKVAQEQSLAEYRARISSTESAKETAQVENRAPNKQTGRSVAPPPASAGTGRQQSESGETEVADAKKPAREVAKEPVIGAPQVDPKSAGLAVAPVTESPAEPKTPKSNNDAPVKDKGDVAAIPPTPAAGTTPGRLGSPSGGDLAPADKAPEVQRVMSPRMPAPTGTTGNAADQDANTGDDLRTKLRDWTREGRHFDLGEGLKHMYGGVPAEESAVEVGSFSARWAGGSGVREALPPELLFVREVELGASRVKQGFWVDWEVLRKDLLEGVRDLLPQATLTPVTDTLADEGDVDVLGRRLASFPAELEPGPDCAASLGAGVYGWSALRNTLILAWAGVLMAIAAIAFLLRAATDLAERRGRFVSAVTHELRTPLTTFVMYSQMLADGMVPEGEARQHYYGTLKREASRLAGIVENVLEFARLSRSKRARKAPLTGGSVRASDLMERLSLPLKQRVEQAQQTLDVTIDESAQEQAVTTDELTLERILFNLVDNACKYGKGPGGVVRVHVSVDGPSIVFTVSDDGPGIGAEDRPRIFKAFERGGKQADGSIPGLGLGLALSRGLAKDLGGDLALASSVPATFVLKVPR